MIKLGWALAVAALAATSGAAAQHAELVLPPSAAGPELVRALSRAVHPLRSKLVVAADPACPKRAANPSTLHVALHAVDSDMYRLCLVWGDQRTTRELGPYTALDAAAREQISTIVEATVEALVPVEVEEPVSRSHSTPRFLLSAGYAPSLLASSHYAHGVAAELGLTLSSTLFVTLHLAHTFPTTVSRSGAAATADALAARAVFGGALPLSSSVALTGLFGVAIERLSVRAAESTREALRSPSPRAPVDPWLTVQAGPRFTLSPSFWLSARAGAAFAFTRREFGFERGDTFVRVLESGPVRFQFELHAGCFL